MTVTDRVVLFAGSFSCGVALFRLESMPAPFVIALAVAAFHGFTEKPAIRLPLLAASYGGAVVFPGLAAFLPLLAYDCLHTREQAALAGAVIPLYMLHTTAGAPAMLAILPLLVLGGLLKHRSHAVRRERKRHHALEDAAGELARRLEAANRELIAGQDDAVHLATLDERNRIAREIHDNVGHLLSSAILQTGALAVQPAAAGLKEPLARLGVTLAEGMDAIRGSVHRLHERSIDLEGQVRRLFRECTACETRLEIDMSEDADKKIKLAFLAVIKEALANVMRHSSATRLCARIKEHPALYQLVIADNGRGASQSGAGLGLQSIRERIEALGGRLTINTEAGFELFITVPKNGET